MAFSSATELLIRDEISRPSSVQFESCAATTGAMVSNRRPVDQCAVPELSKRIATHRPQRPVDFEEMTVIVTRRHGHDVRGYRDGNHPVGGGAVAQLIVLVAAHGIEAP